MALYDSEEDADALPGLYDGAKASTSRNPSRRAGSRAWLVASSSGPGGPASRKTRQSSYETATLAADSRAVQSRLSSIVSSPDRKTLPTSEATLESDTPTVAAYTSKAASRCNGKSRTPPPVSRPKPKRAALDPQALKEMERRRQAEQEEDDFFTRKPVITFRTKKAAPKPETSCAGSSKSHVASPSRAAQPNPSTSPPPSTSKGKERAVVIDLDSDSSSSSPFSDSDGTEEDSDDLAGVKTSQAKKKAKSKKIKQKPYPDIRTLSPVKRPEPDSDSSSSSSTYSVASGSSVQLVRKEKRHSKKKKIADVKPQPKRNRSLSPIEAVDSYVVQHALQDLRRKNNPVQAQSADGQIPQANGAVIDIDSDDGVAANHASVTGGLNGIAGRHLRSPSAGSSGQLDSFNRAASFSLPPMPEAKPLTEQEQEAKFGTVVTIRVEMVFDPRVPVVESNRQQIKHYEAPVIVKTRQRETFHRLFDAVSTFKGVAKDSLTFTYNGKTVYKSGSPDAVHIISNATFKGYTRDVLSYVRLHPEVLLQREVAESNTNAGATSGHQTGGPSEQPPAAGQIASTSIASGSGTTADPNVATNANGSASTAEEPVRAPPIRLTIRGGPDQKVLLAVPPTKTVLSVIKHFLRKFDIDQAKIDQCKLYFDGEEMNHHSQLGQTDVEDEDTLDMKVPAT